MNLEEKRKAVEENLLCSMEDLFSTESTLSKLKIEAEKEFFQAQGILELSDSLSYFKSKEDEAEKLDALRKIELKKRKKTISAMVSKMNSNTIEKFYKTFILKKS